MTRHLVASLVTVALLLGLAPPAAADVTAFWGVTSTPSTRRASGFAVGISLLVVGFEFEYASTTEDLAKAAPSLRTGMVNGLVQTPTSGTQFYLTAGGGFYREELTDTSVTSFGTNIGGGMKLRLAGPFRLRLDYRIFNLRSSPVVKNPQRFYAGANLMF
jgi:hypothetical protein